MPTAPGRVPEAAIHASATRTWKDWEFSANTLLPMTLPNIGDTSLLASARITHHYISNDGFLPPDDILAGVDRIRHIPAVIAPSPQPVVCSSKPPSGFSPQRDREKARQPTQVDEESCLTGPGDMCDGPGDVVTYRVGRAGCVEFKRGRGRSSFDHLHDATGRRHAVTGHNSGQDQGMYAFRAGGRDCPQRIASTLSGDTAAIPLLSQRLTAAAAPVPCDRACVYRRRLTPFTLTHHPARPPGIPGLPNRSAHPPFSRSVHDSSASPAASRLVHLHHPCMTGPPAHDALIGIHHGVTVLARRCSMTAPPDRAPLSRPHPGALRPSSTYHRCSHRPFAETAVLSWPYRRGDQARLRGRGPARERKPMGYSHYWDALTTHPAYATAWPVIVADTRTIVAAVSAAGILIAGPDGLRAPVMDTTGIAVNGDAGSSLACAPFILEAPGPSPPVPGARQLIAGLFGPVPRIAPWRPAPGRI